MTLDDAFVDQIALGVTGPLLAAATLLGAGWGLRRWRALGDLRDAALVLATAGGLLAGYVALQGWPWGAASGPISGNRALALVVAAAAMLAAVDARWRMPRIAWVGAALAVTWTGSWLILSRVASWSSAETLTATALQLAITLALCCDPRGCAARKTALLTVLCAGAGHVLASGSALLGQLAGALAAVFGVATAAAFVDRGLRVERGTALVAAMAFGGLLVNGFHLTEVEWAPLGFVASAPAAAWLALPLRGKPPLVTWLTVLGTALAALAIAAALLPAPSPYYG